MTRNSTKCLTMSTTRTLSEGVCEAMYIDLIENSDMDDATVFRVLMETLVIDQIEAVWLT